MTKSLALFVVFASAVVFGDTAYAHHSFPATYQVNKIVTIRGRVVQLLLRNPHSFLQVDAPGPSGEVEHWSFEWGGATQLAAQGVANDTLKIGDELSITAHPARSTERSTRGLLKMVMKVDGSWSWGAQSGQVAY